MQNFVSFVPSWFPSFELGDSDELESKTPSLEVGIDERQCQ
jgi:hypothetical protein